MAQLKISGRGQVTFRKSVLHHLGVKAGERLELDLLPGGQAIVRGARSAGSIDDFIGLLAGRTDKHASIEEIDEAAAEGWAGRP